jgi:hypothetical protein
MEIEAKEIVPGDIVLIEEVLIRPLWETVHTFAC